MKKNTFPLIALAAAAALTLSACGGGSSNDAATDVNGDALIPLTVQVSPIQYEPAVIALQEGYFEDAGLDVTITFGAGPSEMIASALSGDSDVVSTSWAALAQAVAEGSPVSGFMGNGIVSEEIDSSGVLVREDSPIKTVADLEGKSVAVVGIGTGTEIPLFLAAVDAGIENPETSITQVAIPYAGMQASIESGTVDAYFPADSFYFQMLEAGAREIANPVREFQGGNPTTIWTASDKWLADNGDTIERFETAMVQAFEFYMDPANEDATLQVRADHLDVPLEELPTRVLVPMSVDINGEALQTQLDAVSKYSGMPEVTVEELFWSGSSAE